MRFKICVCFCLSLAGAIHAADGSNKKAVESASNQQAGQSQSARDALRQAELLINNERFQADVKASRDKLQQVAPVPAAPMNLPHSPAPMSNSVQSLLNNPQLPAAPRQGYDSPIVLISLSMPEAEIKALMQEAEKLGAVLVIRGLFKNDFKATVAKMRGLAQEQQQLGIAIDPTLFRRFNVTTVPTFILPLEPVSACAEGAGCAVPRHVMAHGSVTIGYFLKLVERTGTDEEKAVAKKWLSGVKG